MHLHAYLFIYFTLLNLPHIMEREGLHPHFAEKKVRELVVCIHCLIRKWLNWCELTLMSGKAECRFNPNKSVFSNILVDNILSEHSFF